MFKHKLRCPFATIISDHRLCLKHLRETLNIYDNWKDRRFDAVYVLVVKNDDCDKCRNLAEQAYYTKLVQEREGGS